MKKRTIAVICLAAMVLTGCGAVLPEMSDEEAEAIGEYAAITLLRYDAAGRSRLVDLSQMEEEPEETIPVPEQPVEREEPKVPDIPETPTVDRSAAEELAAESLGSCLNLPEGTNLLYDGYGLEASYGETSYLAVEASDGMRLLILRFTLQNTSGSDQKIDLLNAQNLYRVTVNDETRNVLTTMLANDLSTYSGSLPAGGAQEVVLLAEVEANEIDNVDSLILNLKNESKTYTIRLL